MAGCSTTTLSPYIPSSVAPWDRKRVLHLYRRMSFGTHIGNIDDQLAKTPAEVVDALIDAGINKPDLAKPEWWDWGWTDYESRGLTDRIFPDGFTLGTDWIQSMMTDDFSSRVRMFWLNHFVAEWESFFCSSTLWQYLDVLQRNTFGNFKDFVFEIGLTPGMLIYLNGELNNKFEPNENYARELFELFTLGRDVGYVQEDIVQAARALTGWQVQNCNKTRFEATLFDSAQKTIFGKTEDFAYGTLIDHLFDTHGALIAQFICRKLYVEFISDEEDEAIVSGLAQTFLDNNFELTPVYRQLFKSEHFFDDKNIGVKVKSPYQLIIGLLSEFNADSSFELAENIYWVATSIGQSLLNPPDVAGWQGNRTWVDSSTMAIRWTLVDNYSWHLFNNHASAYVALAKLLSGNSRDVEQVVQAVVDYFLPAGLQTDMAYNSALVVFKGEVPENYFEDGGQWDLDEPYVPQQMTLLMQHLGRQPEYQMY